VASRNWRALFAAAGSSAILGIAAAIAFGARTWPLFLTSLFGRNGSLSLGAGIELIQRSIYGLAHWLGAGTWTAWAAHLSAAAAVALTMSAVWGRPIRYPLKASLLCVGSVTAPPYVLPYDLCILSMAAAFLVGYGLSNRFLPGGARRAGDLLGRLGAVAGGADRCDHLNRLSPADRSADHGASSHGRESR
jgi:hypothetical protein